MEATRSAAGRSGSRFHPTSHYFHQSEQTPTHFAMHIDYMDDGRIGLPTILPPELDDEAFRRVPSLLFDDIEIKASVPVQAFCGCSKEMMIPMLYALGMDELTAACEKNEPIELICHICGHSYLFAPDEIQKLLE
jgi:molecular chaperone Hsp33